MLVRFWRPWLSRFNLKDKGLVKVSHVPQSQTGGWIYPNTCDPWHSNMNRIPLAKIVAECVGRRYQVPLTEHGMLPNIRCILATDKKTRERFTSLAFLPPVLFLFLLFFWVVLKGAIPITGGVGCAGGQSPAAKRSCSNVSFHYEKLSQHTTQGTENGWWASHYTYVVHP